MARQLGDIIGYVEIGGQRHQVKIDQGLRGFLQELDGTASTTQVRVGSILSGYATKTQLQQEAGQRVSGDAANAGSGDGTGTSNSGVYSGISVVDVTWVEAIGLLVTPTGPPGEYAFTITADVFLDPQVITSDQGTFNGLWRIVEERVSDSDTTVIASGSFTATVTPESILPIEGGSVTIPASTTVVFAGLPSGSIAATYDTTQTRLSFEFSRASGSNSISGLYGSFAVAWSA